MTIVVEKKRLSELRVSASSLCAIREDTFLAACKGSSGSDLLLLSVDASKVETHEIARVNGSRNFALNYLNGRVFIGVDNMLLGKEKGLWKTLIVSENSENVFWHVIASERGVLYAQEYGEPPSNVYTSRNGQEWEILVTVKDLDRTARHFHCVSYDSYRKMLIATLGDGNCVRISVLPDGDVKWKAVYKGPWQVLPIVVTKDLVVFGMDSGIADGGLVLWHPEKDQFQVLKLRWETGKNKPIQMSDLRLLENGIWLAALSSPRAIIASRDLARWCPILVEQHSTGVNYPMAISEGSKTVAFTTGERLLVMDKSSLDEMMCSGPFPIHEYKSFLQELVGVAYVLKRRLS